MALSEGNFSIRSSASLALGKLGNKRAVEPLIKYLKTNTGVKPETPGNMT